MLQQTAKKCPAFSSVWLIGINFLYFLVGILLIGTFEVVVLTAVLAFNNGDVIVMAACTNKVSAGLSSWGITQAKEDPVTAALPAGSLVTLLVTGVFLMLVSILGWLGVAFNYKNCGRVSLGFYATILIILMIMEFSAAGAVITFTGKLDDFGPALQVKDAGIYFLINQSYADCCCTFQRCPNDTCWLPSNLLYPCDSITTFRLFLEQYLSDRLIPICVIAILIGLVQFFTAIVACCNQCRGRTTEEQKKIAGGPLSYDGMYGDAAPEDGSFGYETYIKGSATRPGSAAAAAQTGGATAPKAPASGGGRAHSKK